MYLFRTVGGIYIYDQETWSCEMRMEQERVNEHEKNDLVHSGEGTWAEMKLL